MSHNQFRGSSLGDVTLFGDENATDMIKLTMPNGTSVDLPAAQLGDVIGDIIGDNDPSDSDLSAIIEANSGDVTHFDGDIFTGDVKHGAAFGKMLSGAPKGTVKKLSAVQRTAASVIKLIPGAALATKNLSPVIMSKGMINGTPTRSLLQGAAFFASINRAETQYTGTTRTQIQPVSPTNPVFQFAGPTAQEGGNIAYAPVIFVQIAIQRQYTVPMAEIKFNLSAVNEAGTAVDARQWSVFLANQMESCFFAIIPFIEISSTVYPSIAQASATNPLTLNMYGVPANANVRVVLPGPDSAQYQYFKSGFGISQLTTQVANTLRQ